MSKNPKTNKIRHFWLLKIFIGFSVVLATFALAGIILVNFLYNFKFLNAQPLEKANFLLLLAGLFSFSLSFVVFAQLVHSLRLSNATLQRLLLIVTTILGIIIIVSFFAPMSANIDPTSTANGTDSMGPIMYIENYPNNSGLYVFYQLIFSLFGRQSWFLTEFLNLFSVLGIFSVLPKLTFQLSSSEQAKRINILLLFYFLPLIFLVIFPYNDLISIALILYSLYFLFSYKRSKTKKPFTLFISSFLLMCAYILRTNTLIIIVAITLYLLIDLIRRWRSKRRRVHFLAFIPILVAVFAHFLFIHSLFLLVPNYTIKYAQPTTEWIAMSLADAKSIAPHQYQFPGEHNDIRGYIQKGVYLQTHPHNNSENIVLDPKLYSQYFTAFIGERLKYFESHPMDALNFFAERYVGCWGDASFGSTTFMTIAYQSQTSFVNTSVGFDFMGIVGNNISKYKKDTQGLQSGYAQSLAEGALNNFVLYFIEKPFLIILSLSTLLFLFSRWKTLSLEQFLFILIFIGEVLFFEFLWETQPIYLLPSVIALIPLASIGLSSIGVRPYRLRIGNRKEKNV